MASLVWSGWHSVTVYIDPCQNPSCPSVAFQWPEFTWTLKLCVAWGQTPGFESWEGQVALCAFPGDFFWKYLLPNAKLCGLCEFLCSEHVLLKWRAVDKTFTFMTLYFSHAIATLLLCDLRKQCYIVASIGFLGVEDADGWRLCSRLESGNISFENLFQGSAIPELHFFFFCLEIGWNAMDLTSTNAFSYLHIQWGS